MVLKYFFGIKIKKLDSFCKKILAFLDSWRINNQNFFLKFFIIVRICAKGFSFESAVWRGSLDKSRFL